MNTQDNSLSMDEIKNILDKEAGNMPISLEHSDLKNEVKDNFLCFSCAKHGWARDTNTFCIHIFDILVLVIFLEMCMRALPIHGR